MTGCKDRPDAAWSLTQNRVAALRFADSDYEMGPRHDEEVELLRRISARDQRALAELYDRVAATLFGVIRRVVRDEAESEDVLQDVLLQVWDRVHTYDPVLGSPVSWLVRIARNRAIDRYRARKVRAHLADGPLEDPAEPVANARHADPERAAVDALDRRLVGRALAALRPEQRLLIEHAFFSGLTHSELSAQFSLPLGTVKTRIRQGLLAMRDGLKASGG